MKRLLPAVAILIGMSLVPPPRNAAPLNAGSPQSFGYDLQFLRQRDKDLVVLRDGEARVIVSTKYQAKVFTSTNAGDSGRSFGWVHYKAFDGAPDPHMNAYGGENRLWLGPEGGRYSLFFPPGAKMEFANWKTPAAFDTEAWKVVAHSEGAVELHKDMQLMNYAGAVLRLSIDRQISILNRAAIDSLLGSPVDAAVAAVGYQTVNKMTNTGGQAWTEATGMPCMWLLDMFPPSPSTTIILPYEPGDGSKPATTDYFGEIPADRIKFENGVLLFKADGKSRGKLGIHPSRAHAVAGSYNVGHGVLTIIRFDVDGQARYLNQEWNTVKPPFSGDAVNAYNDGPLAGGSQMGPFYELESVSPAAFLAPGASQVHHHSVLHFTGPEPKLDEISRLLLGVTLKEITNGLNTKP
jgi:hypothetical protein